jgi:hypothetical protein
MEGGEVKKEVRALGNHPVSVYPHARQSWADVWLRYKVRRKLICKGPTIMSRANLEGDIDLTRRLMVSNPELMETWERDLARDTVILERLVTEAVVVTNADQGCPDVYLATDDFDRCGAEVGLRALLLALGVSSPIRFDWPRVSDVVWPA